ncbi:MAG TPA: hypothetical protein VGQ64_12450, partial [Candidatus Limnocylindrales bacterium]|nr:hypothetical protein [Candidatus Limnocylindrales bacterium]
FSVGAPLAVVLLGVALAACSGSGSAPGAGATASATLTTGGSSAGSSPGASVGSAAASQVTTGKVNANTASVEVLQAAFAAAGITNADRWAREVADYRPYPADPTWAQLRQELAKYNIGADVLEKIIAVLEG